MKSLTECERALGWSQGLSKQNLLSRWVTRVVKQLPVSGPVVASVRD